MQDPMRRCSERGRVVVGWLQAHVVGVEGLAQIADAVPAHCSYSIAELASGYAQAWAQIAEQLAVRVEPGQSRPERDPRRVFSYQRWPLQPCPQERCDQASTGTWPRSCRTFPRR
jgi:hypothetical protein